MQRTLTVPLAASIFLLAASVYGGVAPRVFYDAIPGTAVSDLTDTEQFPTGTPPDSGLNPSGSPLFVSTVGSFESVFSVEDPDETPEFDDNFGSYTRGYLEVPETGEYKLFIASDDASELRLSSDHTPGNAEPVAMETGCCTEVFNGARLVDRSTDAVMLEKGKQYYFALIQKEGTGGSFIRIGWEKPNGVQELLPMAHVQPLPLASPSTAPASNVAPQILDTYYNQPVPNQGQPADVAVDEVGTAVFSTSILASAPTTFQWERSDDSGSTWTDVDGAINSALVINEVPVSDSGAMFRLQVSNDHGNATTEAATLTVNPDETAPTVVSAGSRGNPSGLRIVFSESVSQASAENTDNYSFTGGTVDSATLLSDNRTVQLALGFTLEEGTEYTIEISGVADRSEAGNVIDPSPTAVTFTHGAEFPAAKITYNRYEGIGSGGLNTLFTASIFPDEPTVVEYPTLFEGPSGVADNYGTWMFGVLVPETTGTYQFAIAADDNAQLYLSTDQNPANKQLIASEASWSNSRQYTATPEQLSGEIELEAGTRYYIESFQKDGTGGDNISVTWRKPGDSAIANDQDPIPDTFFVETRSFGGDIFETLGDVVITSDPEDVTVNETETATFSVIVDGTPPYSYQWFVDGAEIGGATDPSFTTGRTIFEDDDGMEVHVEVSNEFSSATSGTATLTVVEDAGAPELLAVGSVGGTEVGVCFNELLDPISATDPDNYEVTGADVTSVTIWSDTEVELVLDTQISGEFTVTVTGVTDLGGNPVAAGSTATGTVVGLDEAVLVRTDTDPATEGQTFSCIENGLDMIADGSDFWNEADAGHFAYTTISGDFDLAVRVQSLTRPDAWTKGGLMARESLEGDSAMVMAVVTPTTGYNATVAQERTFDGASRRVPGPNEILNPTYPDAWVRLRRVADRFVAYAGSNGTDWDFVGETVSPFSDDMFVGLGLTSHSIGNLATAEFRDYQSIEYPGADITITQQPADVEAAANQTATFEVAADVDNAPSGELLYQWQVSTDDGATWTDLAGEFGTSYTTPLLSTAESGNQYRVIVNITGETETSAAAALTVEPDTTPPGLVGAGANTAGTEVTIFFDELIDQASPDTATFTYDNGVTSTGVIEVGADFVVVGTTEIPDDSITTLTVDGIADLSGNATVGATIGIGLQGGWLQGPDGLVTFEAEHYDTNMGVGGTTFGFEEDITRGTPSNGISMVVPNGSGGGNPGAGAEMTYVIEFTQTGTHYLWYRASGNDGNDDSFYGGLDGVRLGDGNEAAMTGFSGQADFVWRSDRFEGTDPFTFEITETGEHVLYVWHREDGSYLDKLLITTDPDYTPTDVGPSESLRLNIPAPTPDDLQITEQPQDQTVLEFSDATVTIDVDAGQFPVSYQWQRSDDGGGTWTDITDAFGASYTLADVAVADDGAQFRVVLGLPFGISKTSDAAALSVDTTTPIITSLTPADGATLVQLNATVEAVVTDGSDGLAPVDPATVTMTINGVQVDATVDKSGGVTTATYTPDGEGSEFEAGSTQEVVVSGSVGGQPASVEWDFEVTFLARGTRYIEAEDFNSDIDGDGTGGEWIPGANGGPTGEPYTGGAYANLTAIHDVDYHDGTDTGNNEYRVDSEDPNVGMTTFNGGRNPERGYFTLTDNYKIGWTANGEWWNYTRDFPEEETNYDVYAHISSGGANPNAQLQLVTSDPTQPNQTTEVLGQFTGAASGDWGTAIFYRMHQPGDPETPAQVKLSGTQTVRVERIGGAMDFEMIAFVPAEEIPTGDIEITEISLDGEGNVVITWEGGGTLEMTTDLASGDWTDVGTGGTATVAITVGGEAFFRVTQ